MPTVPRRFTTLVCVVSMVAGSWLPADDNVNPEQRAALQAGLTELRAVLAKLPASQPRDLERREDALVCAKAVEWLLRHDEFYKPSFAKDAAQVLQLGRDRAAALTAASAHWGTTAGRSIRGYRSKVDGSIQPYALSLPEAYDPQSAKRYPLHVVLHGRGDTLNEVSFIKSHEGKPAAAGQTWIQLDVFGRTNNAYRWAGEADVFEALADVERRYKIDGRRITLWGFSMGGAGAWHLGLHHPSRWSSVGAGAGFVDYYKYQKRSDPLPAWQDKTLRIYDSVNYALNLENVPFVTYGGELDPQLAASLTMQAAAEPLGVPLEVIVGPQMGHKFDDESLQKFMAFHAEHAAQGRPVPPGRGAIRFTTCTLRYNQCEWLTLWELDEQYEPATVESHVADDGTLVIDTANVTAFSIARAAADRVRVDDSGVIEIGSAADGRLPDVYLVGNSGGWDVLDYDASIAFLSNPDRHKRPGLQGPIDDAFMEPFLCVRGTGTPWSAEHQAWSDWTLARFEREWDKWMRGKLPVVDDTELTPQQIESKHLILFGDPGSNSVIAKVLEGLPVEWSANRMQIAGQEYDPATHGVALIYPNPLEPERYVVLNSGMTMHTADFKASNANLYPRLGDAAVLRFARDANGFSENVVRAEIFDGEWKLP